MTTILYLTALVLLYIYINYTRDKCLSSVYLIKKKFVIGQILINLKNILKKKN